MCVFDRIWKKRGCIIIDFSLINFKKFSVGLFGSQAKVLAPDPSCGTQGHQGSVGPKLGEARMARRFRRRRHAGIACSEDTKASAIVGRKK